MIRIAVIDTGLLDTSSIRKQWDGFSYNRTSLLNEPASHEHGSLVASVLMRAFDNDEWREKVHFTHIQAGDRQGYFKASTLFQALEILRQGEFTEVNCSFGQPDFDDPQLENPDEYWGVLREVADQFMELVQEGVYIHAAAGNSDSLEIPGGDADEDVNYPQRLYPLGNGTYVWGSIRRDGVASQHSSDGLNKMGCYWAEDFPILGPDGKWVKSTGDSFACPKGCALSAIWRTIWVNSLDEVLKQEAIHKTTLSDGTVVDYKNPVTGKAFHIKHGHGHLENEWQTYGKLARHLPKRVVTRRDFKVLNFRKVIL